MTPYDCNLLFYTDLSTRIFVESYDILTNEFTSDALDVLL